MQSFLKKNLLVGILLPAGLASAALNIVHQDQQTLGKLEVGTSLGSGIAAQAGDVLVITEAISSSARGTYFVTSSDGGVASPENIVSWDGTKNVQIYTYEITTGGTFDFAVNTGDAFSTVGTYLLRADSGSIILLDVSENYEAAGTEINTVSLSWTDPESGIVIVTYSSGGTTSDPAGLTGFGNGATYNRVTATGTFSGVSSLQYDWVTQDLSKNTRTAGIALTEDGASTPLPPDFTSELIVKADAAVDEAYTGSLIDDAFDPNGDSMTFINDSSPGWLTIASNGDLSGTPIVSNLGTNNWTVLVTDGISGTNSAMLQIIVSEPAPPPVSPQQGTNVLFIAIDDMKPLLGCYGDTFAISPNIDTLAESGVTFLNAQCQWAVCGPSRASIMTGLYPEETGVMGFRKMRGLSEDGSRDNNVVRPNVVTMQQWFRYNGYRTAATGKINDPRCVGSLDTSTGKVAEDGRDVDDPPSWGDPVDPNALPSDFFTSSAYAPYSNGWSPAGKPSVASNDAPDSAFTDGMICDLGISMMQSLATNDAQFFLGVGFKKPHLPFNAPQQYWDLYDRADIEIAEFQDHPENAVSYTWKYATELAAYDEFYDPFTETGTGSQFACTNVPAWKQKELIHGYYACASFIDAQIGRLLSELESLNLHTNTIVVIWGDHGFHLGDHAEWAKHTNLEQAARVPMIIYSPFTGQPGATTQSPVNFVDLYPTLCDLAGIPVPEQPVAQNEDPFDPATGRALKGTSLVPVMNDPTVSVRTGAITLFRRGAMGYSYRTERYRYIEWIDGGSVVARELYDYETDPLETVNLAGEPGYDALMYQYSVSMRAEMDALGLSAGDTACDDLQNSPAENTTSGDLTLPGLKSSQSGGTFSIEWSDAEGWTYNILSKTNLTDAGWQLEQGGVTGPVQTLAASEPVSFFSIELID